MHLKTNPLTPSQLHFLSLTKTSTNSQASQIWIKQQNTQPQLIWTPADKSQTHLQPKQNQSLTIAYGLQNEAHQTVTPRISVSKQNHPNNQNIFVCSLKYELNPSRPVHFRKLYWNKNYLKFLSPHFSVVPRKVRNEKMRCSVKNVFPHYYHSNDISVHILVNIVETVTSHT